MQLQKRLLLRLLRLFRFHPLDEDGSELNSRQTLQMVSMRASVALNINLPKRKQAIANTARCITKRFEMAHSANCRHQERNQQPKRKRRRRRKRRKKTMKEEKSPHQCSVFQRKERRHTRGNSSLNNHRENERHRRDPRRKRRKRSRMASSDDRRLRCHLRTLE
jgi:hypothetical protein